MSLLICTLLLGLGPNPAVPAAAAPMTVVVEDPELEFERRYEAAGDDIDELWKVYNYCDSYGLSRSGRKVLRAIIKLDPEHAQAREASGHVKYDGQWFTSEKKLATYKRKKEEAEAKEKGWVKHRGEWVDPRDLEKLEAGLVRDEDGRWVDEETLEKRAAGWVLQDLEWVSPEEIPQMEAGLFKCGDEWKELDAANRYHSIPSRAWRIPAESGRFHIHTTVSRELALRALGEAESTVVDLVRIFGRTPDEPATFAVLSGVSQYNSFASGDQAFGIPQTEVRGWSSFHGSYFAEVWVHGGPGTLGGGVAYWDEDDKATAPFGPYYVRNAAALSFIERLDPSPETIKKLAKTKELDVEGFFEEKKLPDWLRYGAATYAERYRPNRASGMEMDADRKWSISNIRGAGGLDPVSRIINLPLSADNQPASAKLLNEAGLLVAFMLDGDNLTVKEKHGAFKAAFQAGKPFADQLTELEKALVAAKDDLKAFADI